MCRNEVKLETTSSIKDFNSESFIPLKENLFLNTSGGKKKKKNHPRFKALKTTVQQSKVKKNCKIFF